MATCYHQSTNGHQAFNARPQLAREAYAMIQHHISSKTYSVPVLIWLARLKLAKPLQPHSKSTRRAARPDRRAARSCAPSLIRPPWHAALTSAAGSSSCSASCKHTMFFARIAPCEPIHFTLARRWSHPNPAASSRVMKVESQDHT